MLDGAETRIVMGGPGRRQHGAIASARPRPGHSAELTSGPEAPRSQVTLFLLNLFLAAFESTIAASTQSAVGTTFSAADDIAWVATSYLIVSTAVQPLYGRAADLFGRTAVYLFCLFFFGLGCLGCGLSASLAQIVVARAVCGIGGGGLITVSQICAWDIVPTRSRPLYQALNNMTYGIGAAIGATLGGFLADSVGWRWAYLVPVPLSVLSALVFVTRARPRLAALREEKSASFKASDVDFYGSALLMLSITLLMAVINLGGDTIPWTSPAVPALLLIAVLASVAFFKHEARCALPVLPVRLMRGRYMFSQIGLNLFGPMTVFGSLYLIPPFFEATFGTSAVVAARRLLYPTLAAPLGSILTGLALHRFPTGAWAGKQLGSALLLLGSGALLLLAYEPASSRPEGWFAAHLVWVHLGMGIAFPSSLLELLGCTGNDHASTTSLIFLVRSLGTVLGISASQAMLQNVLLRQLTAHIAGPDSQTVIRRIRQSLDYLESLPTGPRDVAVACYRTAFRAAFGLVVVMGACAFLSVVTGVRARRPDEEEESTLQNAAGGQA
ncbi:hypothetical protein Q5752_001204 [Cryptotrichosporon argae]